MDLGGVLCRSLGLGWVPEHGRCTSLWVSPIAMRRFRSQLSSLQWCLAWEVLKSQSVRGRGQGWQGTEGLVFVLFAH